MTAPMEQRPVIVEVTTRHIVWVDGDTTEEALRNANRRPWYELVSDGETDVDTWAEVTGPQFRSDWDDIYDVAYGGGYGGRGFEAHVDTHRRHEDEVKRAAKRAACVKAGHPNTGEPLTSGRLWCPDCSEYLMAAPSTAVAS